MDDNIYQAPRADLSSPNNIEDTDNEYYVVSIRKFTILFLATFGIYYLYWFYQNWSLYKAKNEATIWLIPRTIFNIFFTHTLFKNIDNTLKKKSIEHSWSPTTLATLYVVITIIGNILDRLPDEAQSLPVIIASVLTLPLVAYILAKAQQTINISQSDPKGSTNSTFTTANYIWCAIGTLVWAFIILMLVEAFTGMPL